MNLGCRAQHTDNMVNVRAPAIQRFLALGQKFMPLINGRYPGNRSGLVIEDLVSDVRRHTQPCHPGDDGSPEIV